MTRFPFLTPARVIALSALLYAVTPAFAATYELHIAKKGLVVTSPLVTQVETFDAAPVFKVTGNFHAAPSWLGAAHGNAFESGYATGTYTFSLAFTVPAGASAAHVSWSSRTVYPGASFSLQRYASGWTNVLDPSAVLAPGKYQIYNTAGSCPNYAWCMNEVVSIDDVKLTYKP